MRHSVRGLAIMEGTTVTMSDFASARQSLRSLLLHSAGISVKGAYRGTLASLAHGMFHLTTSIPFPSFNSALVELERVGLF